MISLTWTNKKNRDRRIDRKQADSLAGKMGVEGWREKTRKNSMDTDNSAVLHGGKDVGEGKWGDRGIKGDGKKYTYTLK